MPQDIIKDLVQEGMAARASYQIWSALRQDAFPDHVETLKQPDYYAFFTTSSSAHFKLIFISLGKIFDSKPGTSRIEDLKKALKKSKRLDLVTYIEEKLGNQKEIRERIKKNATNLSHTTREICQKKKSIKRILLQQMNSGVSLRKPAR